MKPDRDIQALIDFYQNLTPQNLDLIRNFYSSDAYFKDPFNEVHGVTAIQKIFTHMFEQLDAPRFAVTEQIVDANGAVLVWNFYFSMLRLGQGKTQVIRGVSHLKFDANNHVNYHRDYWDAAEELYIKLPIIGGLMRYLQRKLAS